MTVLSNLSSCIESTQLLIIGLGETIWTESTFQLFFSGAITVPHFISGLFEIPEQPAAEKLFRVIRKHAQGFKSSEK